MTVFIKHNIHVGKNSELGVRLCLGFIDEVIWVISEWRVIVKSCIWICNANMDINIILAAIKFILTNQIDIQHFLCCCVCCTPLTCCCLLLKHPFPPLKNINNECIVMIFCISLRHDHLDHCKPCSEE